MKFFSSKPSRRQIREHLRLGFASVAGGLLLLLVLAAMFESCMNPLFIVKLKIAVPSFTAKLFMGEEKLPAGTHEYETRKPTCNISHPRTDVCMAEGDVRIHGKPATVDIHLGGGSGRRRRCRSWKVKPYARKDDAEAMNRVGDVLVREVDRHTRGCKVNHSVPAVVFSAGGYLGNVFHDFSDGIIPLFVTIRSFSGEVQFLVTDYRGWWIQRYKVILDHLTNHDIIDMDSDDRTHCFRQAIVGLTRHGELSGDPTFPASGLSSPDFTAFLRAIFSLDRSAATDPSGSKPPRLLLINRARTRRLTNLRSIASAARSAGFEVTVAEGTDVADFARIVNSCDVMVGVLGAGLTNMVFLPPGGVVVQILPLGSLSGWFARRDYAEPAAAMGLRQLQYRIREEESTLAEQYPRNHTVLRNSSAYEEKGWIAYRGVYFDRQDVRLDIGRFRRVLQEAFELLRR